MESNVPRCIGLHLKCLIIGYLSLVASAVDITFHVLIAAVVSGGFQCDVDKNALNSVEWPWLEPFLLLLNLGTHGFYEFPMTTRSSAHYSDTTDIDQPKCFPGMIHAHIIDVFIIFVNLAWMKFVWAFVVAIHKKDLDPVRLFLHLSIIKLILQIMYFGSEPSIQHTFSLEDLWFLRLADICISAIFLCIINSYINSLKHDTVDFNEDLPPSYIECLLITKNLQDIAPGNQMSLKDITVVHDKNIGADMNQEDYL